MEKNIVFVALNVMSSSNIKQILLVSKNVCHDKRNCEGKWHNDSFLAKYNLSPEKKLHDLLMVKEGILFLMKKTMCCLYSYVKVVCERKEPDNMSLWGSVLSSGFDSNILISVTSQFITG